ncbi:malto-oligosyltrehalose trehalohydrolase [Oceaniglobus roseus]|uniref:malto-oligosyltrehalose trehalohydrolase n=1 Tax=Oceaniglobus roseus TaxID=1737570 RepID=UPI001FE65647|nr:malto-oligosyltrehalose trehalohydrolase [Kandeliimicrobium roseum]
MISDHRAPLWGVSPLDDDRWRFRLWAPAAREVTLVLDGQEIPATRGSDGLHMVDFRGPDGAVYEMIADGERVTDPAARWLAQDVHGPARLSRLAGPRVPSPDRDWREVSILELHVGTFTPEGTFAAAAARMAGLAELGLTAVELMPVGAFGGSRGWGYDGVLPFAPHPAYGTPQELGELVDAIHAAGMLAILDVVYNHFGPEGGTLTRLAPDFFDSGRETPWGQGIDYGNRHVRDYFIGNAVMWVRDYGFDGLRLDAVHQIRDGSPVHLLRELAETLEAEVPGRKVHLIAEDDRNLPDARDRGTITANWNDDYHHSVHCLLTGEDESYYANFAVDPLRDLACALEQGHVEQGQTRQPNDRGRGAPVGHLPPWAFVNANQTHDQIGNRAAGERLIALAEARGELGAMRIAHALLLSAPAIPMLFMGEEEGARAPFLFFADFGGELGEGVRKGRAAEFAAFSQFGGDVPDSLAPSTFAASRPYDRPAADADDWRELTRHALTHRARALVPLLKSGEAGAAEVARTGPRSLHGRWPFHAGVLRIVAHLGALPERPVVLEDPGFALGTPEDPCHLAVKVTPR